MWFVEETLSAGCGVSYIQNYASSSNYYYDDRVELNGHIFGAGCGWVCGAFIEDDYSRKMFDEMCAKYKLVYQTPTRTNRNSGNRFFFAVFDLGEDSKYGYDDQENAGEDDDA